MSAGAVVVALAVLVAVAGCSGNSSPARSTAASSSAAASETVPAGTLQAPGLAAGQAWTSPVGDSATYYSSTPSGKGTALDVGFCAAGNGASAAGVSSYSWAVVAADGTVFRQASIGSALPTPAYPDTKLVMPGACLRGWVGFQLPAGISIARVAYQPEGEAAPLALWNP